MKRRFYRAAAVLVTVALLACLVASEAEGAVLRNKQTAEEIRGKLTSQKISGMNIFLLESGPKKFIKLEEWEIIESDSEPAAEEGKADGGAKDTRKKKKKTRVYFIPIEGAMMTKMLPVAINKALEEAKKTKAELIVFRMDTGGGRVDVASDIIDIIQEIDWAKPVSWIQGKEDRSLSAGAFICLSTANIYMASGTTIGAATPYRTGTSGSAEVDAKFQSAFRAKFRALAQKRGYPAAIADAMVDSSVSVVQVFVDGQQKLLSEEQARQLEREHRADGKFKRGRTITKEGKILTLTSKEALEYKLIDGLAANRDELMRVMEIENYQIKEADWLSEWVKKEDEAKKARFSKLKAQFQNSMSIARSNDPNRQSYMVKQSGKFTVASTKKWQEHTDRCLKSLKACYKALDEIEKMHKSGECPFNINMDSIRDQKVQLDTYYRRLKSERDRKSF